MIRIASIALIALPFFLKGVSSQGFIPSITACANSDGDVGYESIADINNDMEREAALILGGKEPETMYEFVLCPNTDLDAGNETLVPLLDNSIFLCGDEGTSPGCAISGGEMQVEIVRPIDGGHTVTSVSFLGIGFSGFTGAAISGNGVSNTTVTISQGTFSVRIRIAFRAKYGAKTRARIFNTCLLPFCVLFSEL